DLRRGLGDRRRRAGGSARTVVIVNADDSGRPSGAVHRGRDAGTAGVAGDIDAIDPLRATVRGHERHRRPLGRDGVQRDVAHVEVDRLAVLEHGQPIHFDVRDVALHAVATERPPVPFMPADGRPERIDCVYVPGDAGRPGVAPPVNRAARPPTVVGVDYHDRSGAPSGAAPAVAETSA
ncbi:hypothetical protein CF641_37250, partial [Burkholderia pseudomallei]